MGLISALAGEPDDTTCRFCGTLVRMGGEERGRVAEAELQTPWLPIETAPRDGAHVLVYAPGRDGLSALMSVCQWHDDAGWCIDELREPTHWMPLPAAPNGDS